MKMMKSPEMKAMMKEMMKTLEVQSMMKEVMQENKYILKLLTYLL